jgi:hypothetical protein
VRNVIAVASTLFVFVGTVLRMWDSIADADAVGEFAPRTSNEELHRLVLFFTFLGRRESAATSDRQLQYLRTAQGWFFLAIGAFGGFLLAIGAALE